MSYNFKLVNCDTDSIMVAKQDGSPFSEEELVRLNKELNDQFPDTIRWEDDGYFETVLILKAKNYVLKDIKGKVKLKGSSIKASQKEPALKEFMSGVINLLLEGRANDVYTLYNRFARDILYIQDIKPWLTKRTYTEKVVSSTRTNESKVVDAMKGQDVQIGDKVYLYYDMEDNLRSVNDWKGDHNVARLHKRLYDTLLIFENVLNTATYFNYSLKRNRAQLDALR